MTELQQFKIVLSDAANESLQRFFDAGEEATKWFGNELVSESRLARLSFVLELIGTGALCYLAYETYKSKKAKNA